MLPVLPGGGGAEAGRVSVERLTAVTDRSATGISEVSQFKRSLGRLSLTPEAVATPLHAPPLVRTHSTNAANESS